jgi:hypothetical protein
MSKNVPFSTYPKNLPGDEFTAQQNHPVGAWVGPGGQSAEKRCIFGTARDRISTDPDAAVLFERRLGRTCVGVSRRRILATSVRAVGRCDRTQVVQPTNRNRFSRPNPWATGAFPCTYFELTVNRRPPHGKQEKVSVVNRLELKLRLLRISLILWANVDFLLALKR